MKVDFTVSITVDTANKKASARWAINERVVESIPAKYAKEIIACLGLTQQGEKIINNRYGTIIKNYS